MLLNELKERTSTQHQQTESAFDLRGACSSSANYVALLRTMLSLYRPLEQRLDGIDWEAAGVNWPIRRKVALLEKDLAALGDAEPVDAEAAVATIPLDTTANALGCLYVLEGSTLGAQFIIKHIERTLALTPETGAAFFTGYGPATKAVWGAFCGAADHYAGKDVSRIDAACESAAATFRVFEQALRGSRASSVGSAG